MGQSQQGDRSDGIIQRETTRLREQGVDYGRAATLSVDSDRVPVCQVTSHQAGRTEVWDSGGKKRVTFRMEERN